MKIYFTASLTGKKEYLNNYKKIVQYLKKLKCKVFYEQIFQVSKEDIMNESQDERKVYHQYLVENVGRSDAFVAEVSYPSTSVGYEISLALSKEKPVLVLYDEETGDWPSLLQALKEEKVLLMPYNLDNLKIILKNSLDFLRERSIEKRFTMLMAPKLLKGLEKICKSKKIPRSVYIRELIEEDLKKKLRKNRK